MIVDREGQERFTFECGRLLRFRLEPHRRLEWFARDTHACTVGKEAGIGLVRRAPIAVPMAMRWRRAVAGLLIG